MLLERPAVKETAASRHPAHCELRGHSSCFGRNNKIFNLGSEHPNGGWRATRVDMQGASGARCTPPPTPSPLTICASSVQAIGAAADRVNPVGRLSLLKGVVVERESGRPRRGSRRSRPSK